MNRRGFTLIEVIVTITIIGIISGIAYGSITSLQTRNKQKKYKAYEQVLVTGAELYVDQYSRDLWGTNTDTTSYCITYQTLLNENLIQAYNEKNEKIDENSSMVLVTRSSDGQNSYQAYLKITSNSTELYNTYKSVSCTKK